MYMNIHSFFEHFFGTTPTQGSGGVGDCVCVCAFPSLPFLLGIRIFNYPPDLKIFQGTYSVISKPVTESVTEFFFPFSKELSMVEKCCKQA
jgi:hypothetical protein